MNICVFGGPGSGKTTVATHLAEQIDLPYVGSGDVARGLARDDPGAAMALQKGAMAPEAALRAQLRQRLEAAEATRGGWVLEGFPRNLEQLICLMQWTSGLPIFLHLDVSTWEKIERLTARSRSDDNPDAIGRRLRYYRDETVPMLSILDASGVLRQTDGTLAPSDIVEWAKATCLS